MPWRHGASRRCAAGHSFDVASQGYVNAAGAEQALPRPGDSKEMIAARRRFLEAGSTSPSHR
jgi:23S rRNA (guanine745-N1)-methyltransferase